jgi:hypothetical protein
VEVALKEIQRFLLPNGHAILSGPTQSWFYKLCRFIQFGHLEVDYHYHTIYDLEEKFVGATFKRVRSKSLLGIPFPKLFRVTKFQNQTSNH